MKSIFPLLTSAALLLLSGCESFDSSSGGSDSGEVDSSVLPVPSNAPAEWWIHSYTYSTLPTDDYIHVRNTGSKKLHIVGLVTGVENAEFVDLQQPGAFNFTLYPGQDSQVAPDGNSTRHNNGYYYIKIQDWAVEE